MSERRFSCTPGSVCSVVLHLVWLPEVSVLDSGRGVAVSPGKFNEVMRNRMHLFVRVSPIDAPPRVVRTREGRTARVLRQEFAYLCGLMKVFWSSSCFAPLGGGASEATVHSCIEHQRVGVA